MEATADTSEENVASQDNSFGEDCVDDKVLASASPKVFPRKLHKINKIKASCTHVLLDIIGKLHFLILSQSKEEEEGVRMLIFTQ